MNKLFLYLIIGSLWLSACDSNTDETPEVPQTVIDQSLQYFDGILKQTSLEDEEGRQAWEVQIENPSGAVVSFYWTVLNPVLLKMEGKAGPFDYDIWPGNELINFSAAKSVAIAAVKNAEVEKWELAEIDEFIGDWIYTFYIGTQKVYVDALSGNVLQID